MLAMPHVAFAIGFAFLLAPSGWLLRLVSPALTGFELPPDWQTIRDPWGLGLIALLVLKETPFLLLMAMAAQQPIQLARQQWLGASLGFSAPQVWWRLLLPALWPALRLPIYAVAAYGVAVVDLAQLLGPDTPAPLAVRFVALVSGPGSALAQRHRQRRPAAARHHGAADRHAQITGVASSRGGQRLLARWQTGCVPLLCQPARSRLCTHSDSPLIWRCWRPCCSGHWRAVGPFPPFCPASGAATTGWICRPTLLPLLATSALLALMSGLLALMMAVCSPGGAGRPPPLAALAYLPAAVAAASEPAVWYPARAGLACT